VEFLVIWIFLRKKQKTVLILFCTILVNCFTLPLATYTYKLYHSGSGAG
jgi:cytochrome bd-type quinol oxidase subunit 1